MQVKADDREGKRQGRGLVVMRIYVARGGYWTMFCVLNKIAEKKTYLFSDECLDM